MSELQSVLQVAVADRYAIEREVARGGMAVLFLALDRKHERQVALKVLRPELGNSLGAERFLREIKVTAKLQHPHILPLYDSGEAGAGLLYYVTPFIAGESLRQRLDRERKFPVREAMRIGREVADALVCAHEQQIIHRDIKPGNVLLSHGHAVVADFGIARAVAVAGADSLTEVDAALGTPAYMSPEQILREEPLDARTDIYSLGCMLFEMLAGRAPFIGPDGRVMMAKRFGEEVPLPSSLAPETPEFVDQLVARAMARWPDDRFASARECAEALGRAVTLLEPPLDVRPVSTVRTATPATTVKLTVERAAPRRANLGSLVSRTCNRWKQVNAFDAFFRDTQRRDQRRARLCVIHGDEGEGHESLVARLVATRIATFAAEIAGEEGGTVTNLRIPWPDDDQLQTAKRDLAISLFREIAPSYMGDDLSVSALTRLARSFVSPIVVIQHDLRGSHWNGATDALIRWYVESFWGARAEDDRSPHFVVFLKVFYPAARPWRNVSTWFRRRPADKQSIATRIRRLVEGIEACPMTLLSELKPVSIDDVKSWFDHNSIYDSEKERHRVAASIFGDKDARPLGEVEHALERIHRDFVLDVTGQQREVAW